MTWYKTIEQDYNFSNFVEQAITRYGPDMQNHPLFKQFSGQTMRMAQPHDPYNMSGQQRSIVSQLRGDGMRHVGESIGIAMFLYLLEHNPSLIQAFITDAMSASHNHMATASVRDMYMQGATEACGFAHDDVDVKSVMVPPKNDDYEYWYDFNDSEDSVIVTCDLWKGDESDDFIKEFEFEFDDEEEKQSALDEAEKLVRQLTSGEVQLVDLIGNIPVSGTTITATQLKQTLDATITTGITDKMLQLDYLTPLASPTKSIMSGDTSTMQIWNYVKISK